MLVAYSDSEDEAEDTGSGSAPLAAPAPPAAAPQKPQRKQINLGQLLQKNDQQLPFDVSTKLPAGFFDDTAIEPDAGEPDDAAAAPRTGWAALSALLPAPKVAPKASGGASSLYQRAQKLGAPQASKKTAVPKLQVDPDAPAQPTQEPAGGHRAAVNEGAAPRAGPSTVGGSLRPRLDTSMYAAATSGICGPSAPAFEAHTYEEAAGPQMPDVAAEQFAAAADMAGVDGAQMVSISQDVLKSSIGPATEWAVKKPDAEEVQITAKFFNRKTGGLETTYKPNKMQKRKHQINSLAAECAEKSIEFAQRRSAGFKTKQETQAKYGW